MEHIETIFQTIVRLAIHLIELVTGGLASSCARDGTAGGGDRAALAASHPDSE